MNCCQNWTISLKLLSIVKLSHQIASRQHRDWTGKQSPPQHPLLPRRQQRVVITFEGYAGGQTLLSGSHNRSAALVCLYKDTVAVCEKPFWCLAGSMTHSSYMSKACWCLNVSQWGDEEGHAHMCPPSWGRADRNRGRQAPNLTIMRNRLTGGWTGAHAAVASAERQTFAQSTWQIWTGGSDSRFSAHQNIRLNSSIFVSAFTQHIVRLQPGLVKKIHSSQSARVLD